MAEAKGKSDISQRERLLSTYTASECKGHTNWWLITAGRPMGKVSFCRKAFSAFVAAKVTKDKDLPVEHAQLMRAENWNILMTSQMGMLIKVATWGSFLVWQPIEKLWWDVTNRPWRCFHLLWHGPCFGQNKHEKELQTDLHVWVQFSETCFGKRALWFLYGKEVCDNLRD